MFRLKLLPPSPAGTHFELKVEDNSLVMYKFYWCAVALLILSIGVKAQKMAPLFDKLLHISNGDTLPYRLLKPVNPEVKQKFPLVIFLHGAGERGRDNEAHIQHIRELFLDERNRGKYPCYVLAPQCPKKESWSSYRRQEAGATISEKPTRPMQMVTDLIEKVMKEYPIDPSRIYVTGLSMGGYGTWDLLARYPNKFAAAIPICGGGDAKTAAVFKHVPIWAFHGALDEVVPPQESRKMIKALQEAGGIPGYTEYPDIEHDSWVQAYREPHLIHWLFEQRLAGPSPAK
jgi:predicted peptidase